MEEGLVDVEPPHRVMRAITFDSASSTYGPFPFEPPMHGTREGHSAARQRFVVKPPAGG